MIYINRYTRAKTWNAFFMATCLALLMMALLGGCTVPRATIPKDADGVRLEPFAIYDHSLIQEVRLYRNGMALTHNGKIGATWNLKPPNRLLLKVENGFMIIRMDDYWMDRLVTTDNWNTLVVEHSSVSPLFFGQIMHLKQGDPAAVFNEIIFNTFPEWTKAFITEQRRWVSVANTIQNTGADIPPTTESEKAYRVWFAKWVEVIFRQIDNGSRDPEAIAAIVIRDSSDERRELLDACLGQEFVFEEVEIFFENMERYLKQRMVIVAIESYARSKAKMKALVMEHISLPRGQHPPPE